MQNRLFKLVLASMILSTGFNTIAMDAPGALEPRLKKLRISDEDDAPEPMEIEGEVTLVSKEGAEFSLPPSAAKRAGLIAGLLEMSGLEGPITLNELSSNTLAVLVPLLKKLDQLIQRNEQADKVSQIYIPRAYQPFANETLKSLKNEEIVALYNAADFLDIPFILNATAAVIADRVYQKINKEKWNLLLLPHREKEVASLLVGNGFDGVNLNARNYIMRQVTHRMCGIMQEYSIADYITEHGQPQLETLFDGADSIDLAKKQLTSLFGIEFLRFAFQASNLLIQVNCLFNLALDPQGTDAPFEKFTNLRHLHLDYNQLTQLPEGLFARLGNLKWLSLTHNQLIQLPEGLFAELGELKKLNLQNNQLIQLPAGLFAGLGELEELSLGRNQLIQLPEGLFAGLGELKELSLENNQLIQLPKGLFARLGELKKLRLANNQLTHLPQGLFAGLANLQMLWLKGNQLAPLPEGLLERLRSSWLGAAWYRKQLMDQEVERIRKELPAQVDIVPYYL